MHQYVCKKMNNSDDPLLNFMQFPWKRIISFTMYTL